jgi:hypothetical protein
MLNGKTLRDRDSDIKAIGRLVISLSVRETLVGGINSVEPILSRPAQQFIDNSRSKSTKELLEVGSTGLNFERKGS